jgi:hypothetical protein
MADQNNLFPQSELVNNNNGYIPRSQSTESKLSQLAQTANEINFKKTDNLDGGFGFHHQDSVPVQSTAHFLPSNIPYNPTPTPLSQYPNDAQQTYPIQPQSNQYQQGYQNQPYELQRQYQYNQSNQHLQNTQQNQQYDIGPNHLIQNQQSSPFQYQPNADFNTSLEDPTSSKPAQLIKTKTPFNLKVFFSKHWKIPAILLAACSLLAVGILTFTLVNKNPNDPQKFLGVSAVIEGQKSLSQGTPGTWNVTISNTEVVAIEDIELELKYDDNFQFIKGVNSQPENLSGNLFKIPRLDSVNTADSQTVISIQGLVIGQVDLDSVMQGRVSYTPFGLPKEPESRRVIDITGHRTKITSPEIKLSIDPSLGTIQNGGEETFTIKIKNTKQQDYQDLKLRLNYPSGNTFEYISSTFTNDSTGSTSDTPDDGDDTWLISRLPGLSEQTLVLKGKITVKSQQKVSFGVDLSLRTDKSNYQTITKVFKDISVASETLALTTYIDKVDKTFSPGEKLKFVIFYENKSQNVLKNAEILASITDKSNLLDLKTLSFDGGNRPYEINNQIQWTGNNTPQLVTVGPSATGKIEYEVEVKKDVLKQNLNQNDYTLQANVNMKALNLQDIAATGDVYRMRSNMGFIVTGPTELKIAKSTNANRKKYKVQWSFTTEQNQIENIVVKSGYRLPAATWQNTQLSPTDLAKNLTYDPSNGNILWTIDKLTPYTGKDGKNVYSLTFEFTLEQQNQNDLVLLEAPIITGTDNFTGLNLEIKGQEARIEQKN